MTSARDDMPPPDHRAIVLAVVSAAATTLATALATWAVDELRARYGTRPALASTERLPEVTSGSSSGPPQCSSGSTKTTMERESKP